MDDNWLTDWLTDLLIDYKIIITKSVIIPAVSGLYRPTGLLYWEMFPWISKAYNSLDPCYQIDVWTKWPVFSIAYSQRIFFVIWFKFYLIWKFNLVQSLLWIFPKCTANNMSSCIHGMAWYPIGNKPLAEPVLTKIYIAIWCNLGMVGYALNNWDIFFKLWFHFLPLGPQ